MTLACTVEGDEVCLLIAYVRPHSLVSSSEGSPVPRAVTGSGLQDVALPNRTVVVFQAEWIGILRMVL